MQKFLRGGATVISGGTFIPESRVPTWVITLKKKMDVITNYLTMAHILYISNYFLKIF